MTGAFFNGYQFAGGELPLFANNLFHRLAGYHR